MDQEFICQLCYQNLPTNYKLMNHVRKQHNITYEEYVLRTEHNNERPKCKCGCGLETKFVIKKFNTVIHGHNEIIFSDEARKLIGEKNSLNMKNYYANNKEECEKRTKKMRNNLTPESRKKQGKTFQKTLQENVELRNLISKNSKEFWKNNPDRRIEASKKASITYHSRAALGMYKKTNELLSQIMVEKILNNDIKHVQGYYYSNKCLKQYCYKSSYELSIMKFLDENNDIIDWKYESLRIEYQNIENETRNYIPDFIITLSNQKKLMIEAKAKYFLEKENTHIKIKAGELFCDQNNISYVVWWPELCSLHDLISQFL